MFDKDISYKKFEKIRNEVLVPTPIEFLCKYHNANIYIKRDDKLNYSYGGNKVRICFEFMKDLFEKQKDYMIGYGSSSSNLNRVVANLCKDLEIPCEILIPTDDGVRIVRENERLCREFGAKIRIIKKDEVKLLVEDTLNLAVKNGFNPYYVYGNSSGVGNEDIAKNAYQKVFSEILNQNFDYICLARGTGMTMEGLIRGRDLKGSKVHIRGISRAREIDYFDNVNNVSVTSKYIGLGYGKFDREIEKSILEVRNKYNIFLDPTYTGKAFYGMLKDIENGILKGNILFIHTGGYPIYEEWLREKGL